MHVILGLLGSIVTILVLLDRLSGTRLDLGWLNPFLWARRRRWRQKIHGNPVFSIDKPLDAAALLVVATAKCDGDISAEEKNRILDLFQQRFRVSEGQAASLFVSSVHLYGDGEAIAADPGKVLARSAPAFSPDQVVSTIAMMENVAACCGGTRYPQTELLAATRKALGASDDVSSW